MQDALLLGHIFGSVDLLVRCDGRALRRLGSVQALLDTPPERLADIIRIEVIDARRAVPVLDERDCRRLAGYIIHMMVDGAVSPFIPKDAPGWYVAAGFLLYFYITYLFVRHLEKSNIYLKL